MAVELQEMWQTNLGVQVALPNQEWKVYLNSMSELDYDFCRSTWIGDYNDPNTFLDMFVSGSGNNRTGWSHPPYDDLISRAAVETDPLKRASTLLEAERILIETETPIVPLYYFVGVQFYHPERLGGVTANVLDQHPFREMYWKSKNPVGTP
ncbi:MAG: ABC transporter substrate-binding protein [Verrucomicrobiota bacterium]